MRSLNSTSISAPPTAQHVQHSGRLRALVPAPTLSAQAVQRDVGKQIAELDSNRATMARQQETIEVSDIGNRPGPTAWHLTAAHPLQSLQHEVSALKEERAHAAVLHRQRVEVSSSGAPIYWPLREVAMLIIIVLW